MAKKEKRTFIINDFEPKTKEQFTKEELDTIIDALTIAAAEADIDPEESEHDSLHYHTISVKAKRMFDSL